MADAEDLYMGLGGWRRHGCLIAVTAGVVALTLVGGSDAGAVQVQTRLLPGPIWQEPTSTLTAAAEPPSTVDPTLTAKIREKLSRSTASGYSVVVDIAG